jgi:sulfate adenylyltransferase
MSKLVNPHGRETLNPLLLEPSAGIAALERARTLPGITIRSREAGDLVMLGIGGFTPLEGFMGHADWLGVCDDMQTGSGLFWPIPITLSTDRQTASEFAIGDDIALRAPASSEPLAIMRLDEKYQINKLHECREVYKTTDAAHPGVAMVLAQGEINLAGPVQVLSSGTFPDEFPNLFLTPAQTRRGFDERGWSTVAAFQTRNPMHRSHEYLAKIAIETCDGVLVHALLGGLKPGDIPAAIRANAIDVLLDNYFVENTVIHAGYPLDMRYAGPREALLHALFRQNYGCSHLLVGRDHAGVGDYYGPFDAHHIFDQIAEDTLETKPIKIDWTFWCDRCDGMASARTCGCDPKHRLLLSGTKLRKMLSEGEPVPEKFSRPEVLEILREYYEGLTDEENVRVELKGHSAQ